MNAQTSILVIYGICVRVQKTIKVTFLRLVLGMKHAEVLLLKRLLSLSLWLSRADSPPTRSIQLHNSCSFSLRQFLHQLFIPMSPSPLWVRKKPAVCKCLSSHSICSRTRSKREKGTPPFLWEMHAHVSAIHPRGTWRVRICHLHVGVILCNRCSMHFDLKEERALCLLLPLTKKKRERCVKRTENFS